MKRKQSDEYLLILLEKLNAELGEVLDAEAAAPGVYYIRVKGRGEYYVAEEKALSESAGRYGKTVPNLPGILLYSVEEDRGGSKIVEYELELYAARRNPKRDSRILRELAAYGAELCPEYFGTFPAPIYTPWGVTLRYRSIDNGIVWLETDRCKQALAVCYPAWASDLSPDTIAMGVQTDYDKSHGIHSTFGYLYFAGPDACVAIFELMRTRHAWEREGKIDARALMNAIWKHHPDYVVRYNTREQLGLNDIVGLLLESLGIKDRPTPLKENMISLFPDVGTGYLKCCDFQFTDDEAY